MPLTSGVVPHWWQVVDALFASIQSNSVEAIDLALGFWGGCGQNRLTTLYCWDGLKLVTTGSGGKGPGIVQETRKCVMGTTEVG